MNANKMSLLAIDFGRTLPGNVLTKWPVPLTMAESYSRVDAWPELESRLRKEDWGEFDCLRHAYLSLVLRKGGRPVASDGEWSVAQKQASGQVKLLSLLSRTISDWGWTKEHLDLLWMLTKHPETQLEAFQALYQNYTAEGDTPGLYRVLTRLAEFLPEDRRIQNNLAQLRLLLNTDMDRAEKLAADLYSKEPSNPFYASTYAFALYSVGDTDGALEIMKGLRESQLRDPSLATYYGIILAAAGENEKARKYLDLAASGKLLPEERALITRAEESLK
jgi:tetratricopeptide (TPR) repeat protein